MTKLQPKRTAPATAPEPPDEAAPVLEPVEEAEVAETLADQEPSKKPDQYRRRRTLVLIAVAAAAGFGVPKLLSLALPAASSLRDNATAEQVSSTTVPPAIAAPADLAVNLDTVLDAATQYKATNQTFVGFTSANVLIAASRDSLVVSAKVGTTCLYSGILAGVRNAVLSDPTSQACDPSLVAQAQAALDKQAASSNAEAAGLLTDTIAAVSQAAVQWAQMTADPNTGAPSLAGLTLPFPGTMVETVSPDGSQAVVRVEANGVCAKVTVYADATRQVSSAVAC